MTYKTYLEMKSKILKELDLESEDFIQPDELLGYFNDAIDEMEASVHKLGREDLYFLNKATLTLVQNQDEYSLPSDIYANKIRRVVYHASDRIYAIKRLRQEQLFEQMEVVNLYPGANDYYSYALYNPSAASGVKLLLFPTPKENSSNVRIWYIRNANRMVDDTSICDVPEFYNFIYAYVKWKCRDKEFQGNAKEDLSAMEAQKKLMVETLTDMTPDDDNEIVRDLSHYEDHN